MQWALRGFILRSLVIDLATDSGLTWSAAFCRCVHLRYFVNKLKWSLSSQEWLLPEVSQDPPAVSPGQRGSTRVPGSEVAHLRDQNTIQSCPGWLSLSASAHSLTCEQGSVVERDTREIILRRRWLEEWSPQRPPSFILTLALLEATPSMPLRWKGFPIKYLGRWVRNLGWWYLQTMFQVRRPMNDSQAALVQKFASEPLEQSEAWVCCCFFLQLYRWSSCWAFRSLGILALRKLQNSCAILGTMACSGRTLENLSKTF